MFWKLLRQSYKLSQFTKKHKKTSSLKTGGLNQIISLTNYLRAKLTLFSVSELVPTKTSKSPGSATNFKSEL